MGYYTKFTLTIIEGNDFNTDYKKEISESTSAGYGSCFGDDIKWYDHQNDMMEYSKRHPKVLFMLEGEGEETGDLWKEYYRDGKMQRCKAIITFEEFYPEKLED